MQGTEAARTEFVPGPGALDLAARGPGHAHRTDDHDLDGEAQFVGQKPSDEVGEGGGGAAVEVERADFLDQDDVFVTRGVGQGEGGAETRGGVGRLADPLDVLGMDVASVGDDQVLGAAGDEEFAVLE